MVIMQLSDLEEARSRLDGLGVRVVWKADLRDAAGTHLHPKDVGGAILSLDWMDPPESWKWAGPEWQQHVNTDVVTAMSGVTVAVPDPDATAQKWGDVFGVPPSGTRIDLDHDTSISFVKSERPEDEGVCGIDVKAADRARAGESSTICGITVRIRLMRYGVAIPHANRFASASALDRMAAIVEDLGFDSIWTSDHIIVPEGSGYIPEHMLEPLAALSHLAARTSHVTLGISVLVVPYRDPVFTAKYLSSLDVISGGRLVLGVGIGWLEEEFQALGASFEERGAQTDEYLEVMRNLWETETSSFDGKWKHYDSMRMFPKAATERRGHDPDLGRWQHGARASPRREARRRMASHQHEPLGARRGRDRLPRRVRSRGSGPRTCLPAPHARPTRRRSASGAHRHTRRTGRAMSAPTPTRASTSSCSRCRGDRSTTSRRACACSCATSPPASDPARLGGVRRGAS